MVPEILQDFGGYGDQLRYHENKASCIPARGSIPSVVGGGWWDWVKASRNLEAMTWEEFRELFMGKYFPECARHAKAREFLELKQGTMTVLEYVAKFTELSHFVDDYVAMNMDKVRKFEDGLKLFI